MALAKLEKQLYQQCSLKTIIQCELRYIRDENGRECDFVVIKEKKPLFAVECKMSDTTTAPQMLMFKKSLKIPMWYQVVYDQIETRIIAPDFKIMGLENFLKEIKAV